MRALILSSTKCSVLKDGVSTDEVNCPSVISHDLLDVIGLEAMTGSQRPVLELGDKRDNLTNSFDSLSCTYQNIKASDKFKA